MYLKLKRSEDNGIQTIGSLTVYDNDKMKVFFLNTLELSFRNNLRQVSCIPDGLYRYKKKYSFRFGWCYEIMNVRYRSNILIHAGNFNRDTKGCILVGIGYHHIDDDGEIDLFNSKKSLSALMSFAGKEGLIEIISKFKENEF